MNKLGLIFNMLGVVILGLQPYETLWDTGIRPKMMWLNLMGWGFMFIGFALMLLSEYLFQKDK